MVDENPRLSDLLGKLTERVFEDSVRRRTLEEYRRGWEARRRAFRRLVQAGEAVSEGYIPSDAPHPKDVAFGVTRKKRLFLSADMVKDPETGKPHERTGGVSHIALLYAAGLAKTPDDPRPEDDYAVRGIVKAGLGGRIIFWEDGYALTSARYAPFVKRAIEKLLERGLISPDAEVYGAGEDVAVAAAEEIRRDW